MSEWDTQASMCILKKSYLSQGDEVRRKISRALFIQRIQDLKESRPCSIFSLILILGGWFMWMGFIWLQQTSGMLSFNLKCHVHFLVVPHAWKFIFLPHGNHFHFPFEKTGIPIYLFYLVCSHPYQNIHIIGLSHVYKSTSTYYSLWEKKRSEK